jgi:translation initiation factor 3 subunit I
MKFDKKNAVRTAFFYPVVDEENMEKFHIFVGGGQDAKDVALTQEKGASFETRIFSLITGKYLGQIKGHFGPVHSLEISPDGRTLATASEDGTIRLQRLPPLYLESKYHFK